MTGTKLCAVYLRVSTDKQTTANQLEAVRALALARGYEPVLFEEVESAAKHRPVLEAVMEAARRGEVVAVAVAAIDRLDRSMVGSITRILELDRLGVRVLSVRETWLDTDSPARPLLISVFGWCAEMERENLRQRTRAGLARAKREGKTLGRPRSSVVLLRAAQELVAGGASVASAARAKGISRGALRRHLAENPLTGTAGNRPVLEAVACRLAAG